MSQIKVMTIFGTRPEAIKMSPVIKRLQNEKRIDTIVIVTAQHREMLNQVLKLFKIIPDYDLDIMSVNQSLSDISIKVLKGLEEIYFKEKPDLVLVHGDTTTAFIGALAAFYQQIMVGHVEAGLRTYNKYSPFPEEINRHLTGVLADINFAPTENAKNNLISENVPQRKIFVTGNTVIDVLFSTVSSDFIFHNPDLAKIDFNKRKIILLTTHRRENLGQPMKNIFQAIKIIIERNPNVEVVFPVHLNPVIRRLVKDNLADLKRINLIEPIEYQSFVNLMARSYLILTDSGGIQEEAPALGKPVLVLRNTTERAEAIIAGTAKKVGTDRDTIINNVNILLKDQKEYQKMADTANPYGDGKASERIVNKILVETGLEKETGIEFRY